MSKLEFLAWIAEIDIAQFIRLHTLVPFQRAFAPDARSHAHGARLDNHLRRNALRVKVSSFRCCVSCVGEDIDFWGFPYLRVSQHVPGIDYCEKHAETLVSTGFSTSRVSVIRAFSLPAGLPRAPYLSNESNQFAKRYAEIATALMAREGPISVKAVADVINSAARRAGLRRCIKGKKKLLSDLAMEKVPRDWLERLLPSVLVQKTEPGIYAFSIDATTKANNICQPEAYTLALSLLIDTPEEALSALTAAENAHTASASETQKQSGRERVSIKETKKLVAVLKEFSRNSGLDRAGRENFLKAAHDYCSSCQKNDAPLKLEALTNAVCPDDPKRLLKALTTAEVQINDGFIPDGSIIKTFIRIKAKAKFWSVVLDRQALASGQVKYDAKERTLTLSKLPAELEAELCRELTMGNCPPISVLTT